MKINLLDCTLRDGGYYNNWDFSASLVQDYLDAMSSAQVNVVEFGFRGFKSDKFRFFKFEYPNLMKGLLVRLFPFMIVANLKK